MGDATKIDCDYGAVTVDPPSGTVQIERPNQSPVKFRYDALCQVVNAAQEDKRLISRDLSCKTVDPEGHQIEITVHHHPGSRFHTSWARLRVDDTSINLNSYQFSILRSAL